jgi:hypothetical protein
MKGIVITRCATGYDFIVINLQFDLGTVVDTRCYADEVLQNVVQLTKFRFYFQISASFADDLKESLNFS